MGKPEQPSTVETRKRKSDDVSGEDVSPQKKKKKDKKKQRAREMDTEMSPSSSTVNSPVVGKIKKEKVGSTGVDVGEPHGKIKKEAKKHRPAVTEAASPSAATPAETSVTEEGRHYTVSLALPGSIIANAQSLELKSYLAARIARACVVFRVDEIVIFDETTSQKHTPQNDPNTFLSHLLQYLEMPQYLRKSFFPHHANLRCAGMLSPLDTPHHMSMEDECEYREGVVLNRPGPAGASAASYANCGLPKEVRVDKAIQPGTRVTVKFNPIPKADAESKIAVGTVVSPAEPRTARGLYWGYSVRFAERLSAVFTDSPFQGGYDLTIGTSERGESIDKVGKLPTFKHVLIVFGGVRGLEYSLEADEMLVVDDVSKLFDLYFNTCPEQGSMTIRTEEAIPISLQALRPKLNASGYRPSS
ncbi:putative methyltransferase C9orf114 homolog [Sycon ciliatum]|uniref:putative methyltransferase C9orf114 homolog n=1 Tax=Sycon ciliatum TaxID=27933 RepID=UPI0031F6D4D9